MSSRSLRESGQEWFDLFFDLVFAVAVGLWSERVAGKNVNLAGYAIEIPYLLMIWWIWLGQAVLTARFGATRAMAKVTAYVQVIAVGVMASALPSATPMSRLFPLAFVAARMALLAEYFAYRRSSADARAVTAVYFWGFGAAAAIVALSTTVPIALRTAVWLVGVGVDFIAPWLGRTILNRLPLDDRRLPARVTAFTSILLYVSINGIVRGLADRGWSLWNASAAALTFGIVVTVWWIYAARVNRCNAWPMLAAGLPYLYAHFFVVLGVATSSVGVHLSVASGSEKNGASLGASYVSAGLFLWVLAFVLIRRIVQRHRDRFWYCRFVGALLIIPLIGTFGSRWHPIAALAALFCMMVALLAAELRHGSARGSQNASSAGGAADSLNRRGARSLTRSSERIR